MATSQQLLENLQGRTPTDVEATAIETARFTESQEAGEVAIGVTGLPTARDTLLDAGGVTSDLLEPDIEDIRTREAGRLEELRGIIGGQFGEAREELRERGEAVIGGERARLGISRGLGASSSRIQFLEGIRLENEKLVSDLVKAQAEATKTLNFESADRIRQQIAEAQEMSFRARQQSLREQESAFERGFKEREFGLRERRFETDIERQEREDATAEISRLAESGIDITGLSSEEITNLETKAGFTPGTFEAYFDAVQSAQRAETEAEQLDVASKIINILSKIPEGQEITIGDSTYTGLKQVDPKRGLWVTFEEDAQGNVTQVTTRLNPETQEMEIVSSLSLGRIGKGRAPRVGVADKAFSKPNPETGEIEYFFGDPKSPETAQSISEEQFNKLEGDRGGGITFDDF